MRGKVEGNKNGISFNKINKMSLMRLELVPILNNQCFDQLN